MSPLYSLCWRVSPSAPAIARAVVTDNPATARQFLSFLLDRGDLTDAAGLWATLIARKWVVADSGAPNNPTFARLPLPVAFDWALPSVEGLHSWTGSSGLESELSGNEPENCTIAEQVISLPPGAYQFLYKYRTTNIEPRTGIQWQVIDIGSGAPIAVSPDLSSETLTSESVTFNLTASIARLRLVYRRALGTPRITGSLVVISTAIRKRP